MSTKTSTQMSTEVKWYFLDRMNGQEILRTNVRSTADSAARNYVIDNPAEAVCILESGNHGERSLLADIVVGQDYVKPEAKSEVQTQPKEGA